MKTMGEEEVINNFFNCQFKFKQRDWNFPLKERS